MEYDEFVSAEQQRLLGLAHALTGNPHDAWDLTQETLARVAEKWRRITDHPGAYARTVMVRLNIDRLRRVRRERPFETTPDRPVEGPAPIGGIDTWLIEALTTLSPRQRTALALRYVEDLDHHAIAERMGCSDGTARSHLSRGTSRLQDYARAAGITNEKEPVR